MFETTIEAAELFSNTLKCSQCQEISDNLQMCGESCKHPFCWKCINKFHHSDTFVLCPLCKLPLELNRTSNCYLFNNLSSLLGELRSALTKASNSAEMGSAETQCLLVALEKPVERRVSDFCTQHVCDDQPASSSSSLDSSSFVPLDEGEPIERSMQKDDDFLIDTVALSNIGAPVDHSTQKKIPDLFASQAVPDWNPSSSLHRPSPIPPIPSRTKSVPQEWIDECHERRSEIGVKRSTTDASITPQRRSSSRLNEKEKKEPIHDWSFDEEDELIMGLPMKAPEKSKSLKKDAEIVAVDHKKKRSLGGKKGEDMLINAIIKRNEKQLKEALECGWDANERDPDGKTAIFMAAERNLPEMCRILVEHGAVVNACCGEICWTPLHSAASANGMEAAKLLISKGASRKARDLKGRTPEMVAASEDMKMMISRHSSVPLQITYPRREHRLLFLHDGIDAKLRKSAAAKYEMASLLAEATILVVEGREGRATISVIILEAIARGITIVTEDWLSSGGDEDRFEVRSIKNGEDCEYEGGCVASRKNARKMMPPLLFGTSFYLCHAKYGPIPKASYIEIIKAAGGKILSREPVSTSSDLLSPFHARQLSPYFVFFNPVMPVPDKLASNDGLNLVSYNWLQESLARFEVVKPY